MRSAPSLIAIALAGIVMTGCSDSPSVTSSDRITVSASLFPIAEVVARVGGDAVDVVTLTPPGSDAHDVELTAKQVQKLEDSDVVFYFGDNFQPGTQKAIESLGNVPVVDLFDSVELLDASLPHSDHSHHEEESDPHGDHDPHVWLDPANMTAITTQVVKTLSTASPDRADEFASNGKAYQAELTQLGEYLDTTIGTSADDSGNRCASTTLYTAHQGFTYLAHRSGLTLVPIAGVNPDENVSAQYLEELASELKGKDITIFFESLIPSATAEVLADELNVTTDFLNPLEGLSEEDIASGVTYVSAQRENIDRIARALGCS